MEGSGSYWSGNACLRCCVEPELNYAIWRSSRNPGRPYYECENCREFLMWASTRKNLPKEKEVGRHARGMKLQGNEETTGQEKQSMIFLIWNKIKELRMANAVEQARIYEALKIMTALNIVICSFLLIMTLKSRVGL